MACPGEELLHHPAQLDVVIDEQEGQLFSVFAGLHFICLRIGGHQTSFFVS
jgi:hypothetical protein